MGLHAARESRSNKIDALMGIENFWATRARTGFTTSTMSSVHDLPIELIVHIFAFLPVDLLPKIGLVCRRWHQVIVEDGIWERAFMKYWGGPPEFRIAPSSWKAEYLARFRLLKNWKEGERGKKQLAIFTIEQIGSITEGRLLLHKGHPRIFVASPEGVMMAKVEHGARLNRSLSLFSKTFGFFTVSCVKHSPDGMMMAAGLADGNLVVFKSPPHAGLGTDWLKFERPVHDERILPVKELRWIGRDSSQVLSLNCRVNAPSVDLVLWDVATGQPINQTSFHVYDGVSDFVALKGGVLFWVHTEGKKLASSSPRFQYNEPVKRLFRLSEDYVLAVGMANETFVIGVDAAEACHVLRLPRDVEFERGFCSEDEGYSRLVFEDTSGVLWLAIFSLGPSVREVTVRYIQLRCWVHDSAIEDVWFSPVMFVVLHPRSVSLHDAINGRLLQAHKVPSYVRGYAKDGGAVQRPIDEPDTEAASMKRILDCSLEDGTLLLKWGRQCVQVWNFGHPLAVLKLEQRHGTQGSTNANSGILKKKEVQETIARGYQEWREEQAEAEFLEGIRQKYNPEGLGEDELLAQALSLSLASANASDILRNADTRETYEEEEEAAASMDEDLRRALELSLIEQ